MASNYLIMDAKRVSASRSVISKVAMSADANQYGNVFGGVIMGMVDQAAFTAAIRHARTPAVVTVSVDHLSFLHPIHVGDVINVMASVNYVGKTSMEVGVRVETERLSSGEVKHVVSAYLTMVALDAGGKPTAVPPLELETDLDCCRFAAAEERRKMRMQVIGRKCTPYK